MALGHSNGSASTLKPQIGNGWSQSGCRVTPRYLPFLDVKRHNIYVILISPDADLY